MCEVSKQTSQGTNDGKNQAVFVRYYGPCPKIHTLQQISIGKSSAITKFCEITQYTPSRL